MYYCYAALRVEKPNSFYYKDFYGWRKNRSEILQHLIFEEHAIILNLIELTEEEYNGIYNRNHKNEPTT